MDRVGVIVTSLAKGEQKRQDELEQKQKVSHKQISVCIWPKSRNVYEHRTRTKVKKELK